MIGRRYPAGDLSLSQTTLISGAQYARQKIKQKLLFFKGEWFWDQELGIPYFQQILVKGDNQALVQAIYRREIMSVPGIVAVPVLNLELDPASRLLSVYFSATYQDRTGATITVEDTV